MKIFVAGLINIETTLKVEAFPIQYEPVRYPFFGVNSTVAGVGYNISKALAMQGNDVRLACLIGKDAAGTLVRNSLQTDSIKGDLVLSHVAHTAQAVILYDKEGKRAIFTDLKDIQEQTYPVDIAIEAMKGSDIAALCNINFSRALLKPAQQTGITIAIDVHAIQDLDDAYNADYMAAANILFMSHERLPMPPAQWAREVMSRYRNDILVIGMGGDGALLGVRKDDFVGTLPAVKTREIVNTIGAGDALFSAFLHSYTRTPDPYESLRRAVVFASWKIGVAGAAQGFPSSHEWQALNSQHYPALTAFTLA